MCMLSIKSERIQLIVNFCYAFNAKCLSTVWKATKHDAPKPKRLFYNNVLATREQFVVIQTMNILIERRRRCQVSMAIWCCYQKYLQS